MGLSEIIKKKFNERYAMLTDDKHRIYALLIYYGFLITLYCLLLILAPEIAFNLISKF